MNTLKRGMMDHSEAFKLADLIAIMIDDKIQNVIDSDVMQRTYADSFHAMIGSTVENIVRQQLSVMRQDFLRSEVIDIIKESLAFVQISCEVDVKAKEEKEE